MTTKKTKTSEAKEKKYIVIYQDAEAWVIGSKQDIIDDFDKDPELYVREAKEIEIYELGTPISFSFITAQIIL